MEQGSETPKTDILGNMNRVLLMLSGIFFVLTITACQRTQSQSAEFFVFGTLVTVELPEATRSEAEILFGTLQQEFQRMHSDWHAWEPGELTRVNQSLQAGESIETSGEIIELIRRSQIYEEQSGGLFNSAIGKLIHLWGFHTSTYPVTGPPPKIIEIQRLVEAQPSALDININARTIQADNPMVQLDFGGIAKGYAVDIAIDLIRKSGQTHAMVNAGGDLRVIGYKSGKPWNIGVRHPGNGVAGGLKISGDKAVFTSGNYTRFRADADERYAHILDPRTGWPIGSVASATVIANEGSLADAAATALVLAGAEDWPNIARDMGLSAAMIIEESGVIHATAEMMDFFTPLEDQDIRVISPD